jgi:uncharacterized damage-inducible protein DinB
MKTFLATALVVGMLAGGQLWAQQPAQAAPAKDSSPPSYDMKPQALLDLERMQKKFVELAEAVPADKFNWRPSEDSRSFAEVFLHVSGERYQILKFMGASTPEGFDPKAYEKSTTEKAKIIEQLNKSWEHTKTAIGEMNNADFARPLPKLGPDANAGDVVYLLVADNHEHLGQSVAYARVNGIVPPWTVAAKKAAAEKAAAEKKGDNKKD